MFLREFAEMKYDLVNTLLERKYNLYREKMFNFNSVSN